MVRTLCLVLLVIGLLLTFVTPVVAQAGSPGGGASSPDGGDADSLGALVDVSAGKVIVASDTETLIFDQSRGAFEATDMLAGTFNGPVTSVVGVSIEDAHAVVTCLVEIIEGVPQYALTLFGFDGEQWTARWTTTTGAVFFPVLHDGHIYGAVGVLGGSALGVFNLAGDLVDQVFVGSKFSIPRALAVGDGPNSSGPKRLLLTQNTFDDDLAVSALSFDGRELMFHGGPFAQGRRDDGYGLSLAIEGGWAWIGVPDADNGAPNAGRLEVWEDSGGRDVVFVDAFDGVTSAARWGRSLDLGGDVMAFSDDTTNLLEHPDARSVRIARFDGERWGISTEIHHSLDSVQSLNFGADVAVDESLLVVGEPRGRTEAGRFWWRPLPAASVFDEDLERGIAGLEGAIPSGRALGATFSRAPFLIEVRDARPRALSFLVVGLDTLAVPFKSGTLFPTPHLVVMSMTGAAGDLSLAASWPSAGVPSHALFFQAFVQDPAAAEGFAATPGFRARQF